MASKNLQVLLRARPIGAIKQSDFEIVRSAVPAAKQGQVLVKNLYLSLDPAMRGWMNDVKSYIPPVELGAVMRGGTVAQVVDSKIDGIKPGEIVTGMGNWQEYAVLGPKDCHKVILPPGLSPTAALGALGMTGMTAYFGLLDVGKPKAGETLVVSGAAGAVGSLVGQIGKHIIGMNVVGLAGSEEKCRWLKEELGFDAAINYRASKDLHADVKKAVRSFPRKGIDVYFDNVGGDTLDVMLRLINQSARVVICGAISQYNKAEGPAPLKNYLSLLVNRASMEGFIVFDYASQYKKGMADMAQWILQDKVKFAEHIEEGLEQAPQTLLKLFDGSNKGKLIVKIADPEPAAKL